MTGWRRCSSIPQRRWQVGDIACVKSKTANGYVIAEVQEIVDEDRVRVTYKHEGLILRKIVLNESIEDEKDPGSIIDAIRDLAVRKVNTWLPPKTAPVCLQPLGCAVRLANRGEPYDFEGVTIDDEPVHWVRDRNTERKISMMRSNDGESKLLRTRYVRWSGDDIEVHIPENAEMSFLPCGYNSSTTTLCAEDGWRFEWNESVDLATDLDGSRTGDASAKASRCSTAGAGSGSLSITCTWPTACIKLEDEVIGAGLPVISAVVVGLAIKGTLVVKSGAAHSAQSLRAAAGAGVGGGFQSRAERKGLLGPVCQHIHMEFPGAIDIQYNDLVGKPIIDVEREIERRLFEATKNPKSWTCLAVMADGLHRDQRLKDTKEQINMFDGHIERLFKFLEEHAVPKEEQDKVELGLKRSVGKVSQRLKELLEPIAEQKLASR